MTDIINSLVLLITDLHTSSAGTGLYCAMLHSLIAKGWSFHCMSLGFAVVADLNVTGSGKKTRKLQKIR